MSEIGLKSRLGLKWLFFSTKMHFNLLVRFVGRHLSDTTLKLGRSTIEPLHMNLYAIKLYDRAEPAEGGGGQFFFFFVFFSVINNQKAPTVLFKFSWQLCV